MAEQDRKRWNQKHAGCRANPNAEPDEWLAEALQVANVAPGRALDVACGLGHNAIWLASQGWQVDAVDISATGLKIARQSAAASDVHINWIEADLDDWTPDRQLYDLVLVFRFLDRTTVPQLVRTALRPGGWLIYETFSAAHGQRSDTHIRNPAYLLSAGELPALFPDIDVVTCREDALPDRTVQRLLGLRR